VANVHQRREVIPCAACQLLRTRTATPVLTADKPGLREACGCQAMGTADSSSQTIAACLLQKLSTQTRTHTDNTQRSSSNTLYVAHSLCSSGAQALLPVKHTKSIRAALNTVTRLFPNVPSSSTFKHHRRSKATSRHSGTSLACLREANKTGSPSTNEMCRVQRQKRWAAQACHSKVQMTTATATCASR
jgi:hypothetical protein